jgi:hypothetical protein
MRGTGHMSHFSTAQWHHSTVAFGDPPPSNSGSDGGGNGTQMPRSAASSKPAVASRTGAEQVLRAEVLDAVRRLVQDPASVAKLLQMLVGLASADAGERVLFEGWNRRMLNLTPFSDAMRHLQQQHTLEAGSLAAVQQGLRDVVYWTMEYASFGLHIIHYWALCQPVRTLPLQLLQLLGVPVDLPCLVDEATCREPLQKLVAAVGTSAPPLALALAQPVMWVGEVLAKQLGVVEALVAAGASYKWKGPAGATVLSLAVELPAISGLQALLARPNALLAFTPKQVSAALVAAARVEHDVCGCMVLEALAAARLPEAGVKHPASTSEHAAAAAPAILPAGVSAQEDPSAAAAGAGDTPAAGAASGEAPAAASSTALVNVPAAATATGNKTAVTSASGNAPAAASGAQGTPAAASAPEGTLQAASTGMQTPASGTEHKAAGLAASGDLAVALPAPAGVSLAAAAAPNAAAMSTQSAPAAPALVLTPAAVSATAQMPAFAIKERHVDLMRRLLAAGVNPNVRPDSKSNMAIHEVVLQAGRQGSNLVSSPIPVAGGVSPMNSGAVYLVPGNRPLPARGHVQ